MNIPPIEMLKEANARVALAMADAFTAVGNLDPQTARTVAHATTRMQEARMLLGLAEGIPHKTHPSLQALHQAVVNADKMARSLLDADLPLDDMSEEQIHMYHQTVELAELAYNQWRVNSTLALMHLSSAISAVKKEGQ